MKRQIVVTPFRNGMISCLYEDDVIVEAVPEQPQGSIRVGDIYIGKVMKIVSNISAAFVAIAPGVNGYYALNENRCHIHADREPDEKLSCGDEIVVQVSRENLKTKAFTLSSHIALAGEFAVLDTGHGDVRFSRKITDEETRKRLEALVAQSKDTGVSCGFTIRTAAAHASEEDIAGEVRRLCSRLRDLMAVCRMRTCYTRLLAADPEYIKMMRRYMRTPDFDLITDIREVYDHACACLEDAGMAGNAAGKIRFYDDPSWPLLKLKNIESQLEKATAKKVWMKSGAYLVIEQTEAMAVIDVNTGKNLNKKDIEKHFLDVNLEAAAEICRQVRLRNLSGIIIADFINMKDPENGRILMQKLREYAAADPVQFTVVDRTKLQLVEMTRRKIRRSLAEMLNNY